VLRRLIRSLASRWRHGSATLHPAAVRNTLSGIDINLTRSIKTLSVAKSAPARRLCACMITARQIRAARALLGWSQQNLADKAVVSLNAVTRLERGEVDPRFSTVMAVQKAITKAGIEFISEDDRKGEGVRLAKTGT